MFLFAFISKPESGCFYETFNGLFFRTIYIYKLRNIIHDNKVSWNIFQAHHVIISTEKFVEKIN